MSRSDAARKGWATRRRREATIRDRWTPARDAREQMARDVDRANRALSNLIAAGLYAERPDAAKWSLSGLAAVLP